MTEEIRNDPSFPMFWKAIVFFLIGGLLERVLRVWLSEAVSSGIALFVAFMLFHLLPPYFGRRPEVGKTLLSSAAGAVVAFLLTRFL